MALRIRLSRGGRRNLAFYSIVVAESTRPRDGKFVEKIGTYNPLLDHDHADRITIKSDRFQYWTSVGAQPSDRVARLLSTKGLTERPALNSQTTKNQPKKKAQERLEQLAAAEEKKKAEAEAAKQAAADAAAAADVATTDATDIDSTLVAAKQEESATA